MVRPVSTRLGDRTAEPVGDPAETPVLGEPDTASAPEVATPGRHARPQAVEPAAPPWWRRVPRELLVLTFLAAVTRLTAVSHPGSIVFDEVYFREFALRYLDGTYFFDIHPPLGKLLLAGWAELFGVSATVGSADPAVALRVLPALAGVGIVAMFYQFMRELTASRRVATFGAALVLLDNAILTESRLILTDSMLLLFGLSAITCYLVSRRRTGRGQWVLLAVAALLAGTAASVKWTGLTALGVIGIVWFAGVVRNRVAWRRALPQLAVILLVPAVVYISTFAIHFALLTRTGPGAAFMSPTFQSTLVGAETYDPAASLSFPEKFIELNVEMHNAENSLADSTHPYSSKWTSWPLLQRPIYYWTDDVKNNGAQEYIYLQGNPLIWWGTLAGLAVVAVGWMRRPDLFARHQSPLALLGVAWAGAVLPFATIERPAFLYHYFYAFLFSVAAVSIGVGVLAGWMTEGDRVWRFPSRGSAVLYWGLLGVALAGFLYFAPLSYGLPLTDQGIAARAWLDSWR